MDQDNEENDISQDLIDFVASIQNDSSNQMIIDESVRSNGQEEESINVDANNNTSNEQAILECSSQNDLNVFLALNDLVNNTIVNIEKSYQTNETNKASEIFEKDDQECPDNIELTMIPDDQIAATRKKKSYSFDSISTINEQVETPKQASIEVIPAYVQQDNQIYQNNLMDKSNRTESGKNNNIETVTMNKTPSDIVQVQQDNQIILYKEIKTVITTRTIITTVVREKINKNNNVSESIVLSTNNIYENVNNNTVIRNLSENETKILQKQSPIIQIESDNQISSNEIEINLADLTSINTNNEVTENLSISSESISKTSNSKNSRIPIAKFYRKNNNLDFSSTSEVSSDISNKIITHSIIESQSSICSNTDSVDREDSDDSIIPPMKRSKLSIKHLTRKNSSILKESPKKAVYNIRKNLKKNNPSVSETIFTRSKLKKNEKKKKDLVKPIIQKQSQPIRKKRDFSSPLSNNSSTMSSSNLLQSSFENFIPLHQTRSYLNSKLEYSLNKNLQVRLKRLDFNQVKSTDLYQANNKTNKNQQSINLTNNSILKYPIKNCSVYLTRLNLKDFEKKKAKIRLNRKKSNSKYKPNDKAFSLCSDGNYYPIYIKSTCQNGIYQCVFLYDNEKFSDIYSIKETKLISFNQLKKNDCIMYFDKQKYSKVTLINPKKLICIDESGSPKNIKFCNMALFKENNIEEIIYRFSSASSNETN